MAPYLSKQAFWRKNLASPMLAPPVLMSQLCVLGSSLCAGLKDAGVKLVAEKPLPGVEGARAQLKLYNAPPHVMDPQDASLTRLSSSLGVFLSHMPACKTGAMDSSAPYLRELLPLADAQASSMIAQGAMQLCREG